MPNSVCVRAVATLAAAAVLPVLAHMPAAAASTSYGAGLSSQAGGVGMDQYHHLGSRPLRPGQSGHDVRVAQDYLRRAGFRLTIDGVYGGGMVKAVRLFERANGLRPDGALTLPVITVLRGYVERGAIRAVSPALPPTADRAGLNPDGTATAPDSAPPAVQQIIAAGNLIAHLPYRYGGGHGSWQDTAYDCSGSVSFALHGAGLLKTPLASYDLAKWGAPGPGQWVTIYANGGHTFMVVAGLRFDTSGRAQTGSRWQTAMRSGAGYTVVHPVGL